jgi:hypothetical protein
VNDTESRKTVRGMKGREKWRKEGKGIPCHFSDLSTAYGSCKIQNGKSSRNWFSSIRLTGYIH